MKLSKLVGERFKEKPSDALIDSHILFLRGGYIKNVANGIFSLFMPLKRMVRKIEAIIRDEMDKIDGQEVLFPVVMPASLWNESGRLDGVGKELVRFTDRNDSLFVLGMTHEEAAVHLVRDYGHSYASYPFMIYQIQTKFRDEARPRGGLIRVREFTMKDAYSFHTSQSDLEQYYEKCHEAYRRIFNRVGLSEVISVASDPGMMGGDISHEFMLISPAGEDSIALCDKCDFMANVDVAKRVPEKRNYTANLDITLHPTPNACRIEDVCLFFECESRNVCKAVVYKQKSSDEFLIVFIRGDLDVNETKVANFIGEDIQHAVFESESNLIDGFIGPYNLQSKCKVLFDFSLTDANNLVCGANKKGFHYTGISLERDCLDVEFNDFAKIREGDICPKCLNNSILVSRGIEVGNIFQLGNKYTKSMNMQYSDCDGKRMYPIMGCYGIGVGRLAAAVCETFHDDKGPIWPLSISPWHVHLCCLRADDEEVKAYADKLYNELISKNIEVLYDERKVSVGVMFSDADLLGMPIRLIVSKKSYAENYCEVVQRDKSITRNVKRHDVVNEICNIIQKSNEVL